MSFTACIKRDTVLGSDGFQCLYSRILTSGGKNILGGAE